LSDRGKRGELLWIFDIQEKKKIKRWRQHIERRDEDNGLREEMETTNREKRWQQTEKRDGVEVCRLL
jgi:hypothetical protein